MVAVIGDVGGHFSEFHEALVGVGMDPRSRELPPGVCVVQVGDLVHKGPDSADVLELVEELLAKSPVEHPNYVQLMGNHEGYYLGAQQFAGQNEVSFSDQGRLARWKAEGSLALAVAVSLSGGESPTPLASGLEGEALISHAGLTHGLWKRVGSPRDAVTTVRALAASYQRDPRDVIRAGMMLGNPVNPKAGVLWAHAGEEVYPGWMSHPLPFHLIHGHTTAVWWARKTWSIGEGMIKQCQVDEARRHTKVTTPRGIGMIGCDPGFGRLADGRLVPVVLPGARISAVALA